MRDSTKHFIRFAIVSIASLLLALGVYYFTAKRILFNQMRDQMRAAVVTGADLIDWKGHDKLLEVQDMNGPIYKRIRDQMETFVKANQGPGIKIRYAYTLRPVMGAPSVLEFVIDTDNASTRQKIGNRVTDLFEVNLLEHNREPYVMDRFGKSPWGYAISAYAPIKDDQGHYMATLGIDVYADEVDPIFHRLIWRGGLAFLVGGLLLLICSYWLSRRCHHHENSL